MASFTKTLNSFTYTTTYTVRYWTTIYTWANIFYYYLRILDIIKHINERNICKIALYLEIQLQINLHLKIKWKDSTCTEECMLQVQDRFNILGSTIKELKELVYYIRTCKRNVTKYGCNLLQIENENFKLSYINWMLNVKRGNLFTKFGFPPKDNCSDKTSIKSGNITK